MIRLYLDWNIISKIRTQQDKGEDFKLLSDALEKHPDIFLIPFTSAHLNDLITSYRKSDHGRMETLKDLDFLEKITHSHCLAFNYHKNATYPEIYNIKEYFFQLLNDEPFTIDNVFKPIEDPLFDSLKALYLQLLKVTPASDVADAISKYPKGFDSFKEVFSDTISNGSQYDLLSDTIKMMNRYQDDPDFYRKLRNKSLETLKMNHDYSQKGNPIELISKNLQKSSLKKTFDEFVEDTVKSINNGKELSNYERLVNSFLTLDFCGYYKDSRFKNLLQDACHVYYGAYCDYFITDDNNTYQKAKVLYEYFNIKTRVCSSIEALEVVNNHLSDISSAGDDLLSQLPEMILNFPIVYTQTEDDGKIINLHVLDLYALDFFNRLQVNYNPDQSRSIVLFKKNENLSNFEFYSEIESLTNKVVEIFGPDIRGRAMYDSQKENIELSENRWYGRKWFVGKVEISYCCIEQFRITLLLKFWKI